jgi:putative peptidoglycan lipid II flippase
VGSIVAYNVAFTVLQIPLGVIGMPLGVVLLPAMSRAVAAGAMRDFGALVRQSLRLLMFVMLFVTVVGIVVRRQVVVLLFGYGNFDADALALTADTLLFFLGGLAGHSMIVVLARAFYSGQDTRTPVIAAIMSVVVNVTVSIATVGTLGLAGLALGIALGAWVEAGFLGVLLWKRNPSTALGSLLRPFLVFGVGAVLAGIAAFAVVRATESLLGVDPGKVALLLQVVAATAAAATTYVLYSRALAIPELPQALALARSGLRRGRA